MKYLDYARLLFFEQLAEKDERFSIQPIDNSIKSKLFIGGKHKSAIWNTGLSCLIFINVSLNKKHGFMEIQFGWFPENTGEIVELWPRRTRIVNDHSELLLSTAAFQFDQLLDFHPIFLPNQKHLNGTYCFMPNAPVEKQNSKSFMLEQAYCEAPDVNDERFKSNCKLVIDFMVSACSSIVVPYLNQRVKILK